MRNVSENVYANDGNSAVLALVPVSAKVILDVGCGTGSNARRIRARAPEVEIFGITGSESEADLARMYMNRCWVSDLENGLPSELEQLNFDCIVFSHVLEHLRDPGALVASLARRLRVGGTCVIAVPNVLNWRERWDFIRGKFEYRESGTLDATHLRFFTYDTAANLLLKKASNLRVDYRGVTGSVPLWIARRRMLSAATSSAIDAWGRQQWPNLFGSEVLIRATRIADDD